MTGVSAGRWSLFSHLVLAAFAQVISVGLLRLPTPADFQHQNPSGSGPVFRVAFQPLAAPDWAPLERRFAGAAAKGSALEVKKPPEKLALRSPGFAAGNQPSFEAAKAQGKPPPPRPAKPTHGMGFERSLKWESF